VLSTSSGHQATRLRKLKARRKNDKKKKLIKNIKSSFFVFATFAVTTISAVVWRLSFFGSAHAAQPGGNHKLMAAAQQAAQADRGKAPRPLSSVR